MYIEAKLSHDGQFKEHNWYTCLELQMHLSHDQQIKSWLTSLGVPLGPPKWSCWVYLKIQDFQIWLFHLVFAVSKVSSGPSWSWIQYFKYSWTNLNNNAHFKFQNLQKGSKNPPNLKEGTTKKNNSTKNYIRTYFFSSIKKHLWIQKIRYQSPIKMASPIRHPSSLRLVVANTPNRPRLCWSTVPGPTTSDGLEFCRL